MPYKLIDHPACAECGNPFRAPTPTRFCSKSCARRKDLTDQRFGRLLVVSYAYALEDGAHWLCRCDCGREIIRSRPSLVARTGRISSCGCYGRDLNLERGTYSGLAAHRKAEYTCWDSMIRRCHQATHPNFRHYGGRGITVCEQWRTSFITFLEDMGPRPSYRYSIERIDNDGDYEPDNCCWATHAQQMKNRRHCPTCTCLQ